MRNNKTRFYKHILALILTVMLFVGIFPTQIVVNVLAATTSHPEVFTFTVTDGLEPVKDATVVMTVTSTDAEDKVKDFPYTITTDNDGVAMSQEITDKFALGENIELSYTATKIGYEDMTEIITVTDSSQNIDVPMTAIEKVKLNFTIEEKDSSNIVPGAKVTLTGYETVSAVADGNGAVSVEVYKGQNYNISCNHEDYLDNVDQKAQNQNVTFDSDKSITYHMTAKKEDDKFVFEKPNHIDITYGDTDTNIASSTLKFDTVTYSVDDSSIVSVDSDGKITANKKGTATITATMSANATYKRSTAKYSIQVNTIADEGFKFDKEGPLTIPYVKDGTFTNIASGGFGTSEIMYEVNSGKDVVKIDIEDNKPGQIKMLKVGKARIRAVRFADDHYSLIDDYYDITIEQGTQTDFKFDTLSPEDQKITNGTFTNKATGGQSGKEVSYKILKGSECAQINEETGTVTFISTGEVTIQATLPGNENYKEITAEYNLTIVKEDQNLAFTISNPTNIVYSEGGTFPNEASGGNGQGAITYEIKSGNAATVDSDGVLTFVRSGTVEVRANKEEDGNYNATSVSYTITIDKAEQSGFEFIKAESDTITYSPNSPYILKTTGGQSNGDISYEILEGDAGEIGEVKDELLLKKAGSVTIKATMLGNDCYNDVSATYTITIERANQTGFAFEKEELSNITYNDNGNIYINIASGGESSKDEIIYLITKGDAAKVDSDTGILTIEKAGEVTVKATKSGDDCYNPVSVEYKIIINKGNQHIAFAIEKPDTIRYGNSFENIASKTVDSSNNYGTEDITYEIVRGANIASIDYKTGALTFNDQSVGTIEVIATKAEDDRYNEATAKYELKVEYLPASKDDYTLSGASIDANSGWYTGDVTITAKEGYELSYSNDLTKNDWSSNLVFTTEGANERKVYLRKKSDVGFEITDAILIDGASNQIDKTEPYGLNIDYSTSIIDMILGKVTFGFYKAPPTVKLTASDDISKLKTFTYTYTFKDGSKAESVIDLVDDKAEFSNDGKTATYKLDIPAQFNGTVSFFATDNAGQKCAFKDKEDKEAQIGLVVDSITPKVNISYSGALVDKINKEVNETVTDKDRLVYAGTVTGTIVVEEANFFPNNMVIYVMKDNVEVKDSVISDWSNAGDKHTCKITLSSDGDYKIKVKYNDKSTNGMEWESNEYATKKGINEYESNTLTVDTTAPLVNVLYDENTKIQNKNQYNAKRTATIKIKDRYFDSSQVMATIIAKDNQDNEIRTDENKIVVDGLKNSNAWTKVSDGVWQATITYDKDARYTFAIEYSDSARNNSIYGESVENAVKDYPVDKFEIDSTAPTRVVEFSTAKQVVDATTLITKDNYAYKAEGTNSILYYDGDVTATLKIADANFNLEDVKVKVNDEEKSLTAEEWIKDGDEWTSTIKLSGDGDYIVTMSYADTFTNKMTDYTSEKIVIDTINPIVNVSYSQNKVIKELDGIKYYNAVQTATITINEHNFRAYDVDVNVTAKDITGSDVAVTDFAADLKNRDSWTPKGDIYTATVEYSVDANYTFDISYNDLTIKSAGDYTKDMFIVDTTAPTKLSVYYSENLYETMIESIKYGYYNEQMTVTITADDITSGVDNFMYSYIKSEGVSSVNAELLSQGIENAEITYSNNGKTAKASFNIPKSVLKEDNQFNGTVEFTAYDKVENNTEIKDDNTRIVVDNIAPNATVTYNQEEQKTTVPYNDQKEKTKDIYYYKGDITATLNITEANFYSEDVSVKVSKDGGAAYAVEPTWDNKSVDLHTGTIILTGDGDYIITVNYQDRSKNEMATYTSNQLTIDTINPVVNVSNNANKVIRELDGRKYYDAVQTDTITITEHNFRAEDVDVNVTAKDVTGTDVPVMNFSSYLKDPKSWTKNGDVYTATVEYSVDANYTFDIKYCDLATRVIPDYTQDKFTVDTKAPTNLSVTYSEDDVVDKIIGFIKYGYYNKQMTVTITADDITSGIDNFMYSYLKSEGVSSVNAELLSQAIENAEIKYTEDKKTATATFNIPKSALEENNQFNGTVEFTAYDKAENNTEMKDNTRIVVDNIAPNATVSYNEPVQKIGDISYYDGNITATLNITEANFYSEDVSVMVSKDGGKASAVKATWVNKNVDLHTGTIKLTGDGDYIITVSYTDRSNNVMTTYTSNQLTIDTINPVVNVSNSPNKIIRELDGGKYYDAVQTDTITITEHNFRPDDVDVNVTAKDVTGSDVAIKDYTSYLKNRNSWTKNGDVYTATITYSVDANYTFDISYHDLAKRAISKYTQDKFTVDTTAPTNTTVSYSTDVFNTIIESIKFGYYNEQMTVTITADDVTASVNSFKYSYLKSEGVSSVNAELLSQEIENAEITYSNNGKTATATFNIPKSVLEENDQFNGTVEFTAYDRAENNTEMKDNTRIVVDNIAPNATVSYNDPVQKTNDISYYSGDITATLNITEANFNSEDVSVMVSKEGGNAYTVAPTWDNGTVDVHTGTITLVGDGDYIMTVVYKDKSNNEMATYTSNQLTIDATKPVITVQGIANENAKNDKGNIGFVITSNDTNFDVSKFEPQLTAVTMDEEGNFTTENISIGEMATVTAGQTYSYTIENLDTDGIYTLTCAATDMANNSISDMIVVDSNNAEMQTVEFSVNRNGSTFMLDKNTGNIVDTFYVQSIKKDVVLVETNADPLKSYSISVNGKKLADTDYSVDIDGGKGTWSKYTYSVKASLFEEEGAYTIVASSVDKVENAAYSDVKKAKVSFVVDKTAPVITASGLSNDGRYQVQEQTVNIIPSDDGGKLSTIKVEILDRNGNVTSTPIDLSDEKFEEALVAGSGKLTFTIGEGMYQQARIVSTDSSKDESGNANTYDTTFTNITVSTNPYKIFWANKVLRYSSIGGISLLAAALAVFIYLKKRKISA